MTSSIPIGELYTVITPIDIDAHSAHWPTNNLEKF